MSINPYILLGIGSAFALLYALVITIGWARTRHNRRSLQHSLGLSLVPTLQVGPVEHEVPKFVHTFSLTNNTFLDADGHPVDVSRYSAFVAVGRAPGIDEGDLLLKDDSGQLRYVFSLPDLRLYR